MKKLLLLLLIISPNLFSQSRITIKLGDFNQVKVFSGLNVKLIRVTDSNTQNYVEIKGDNSEDVVVKNINGLLKFSVLFPKAFDHDSTLIKLYYTSDINIIDANEGAVIMSDKPIHQDFIEIKGQEGAQVELIFEVKTLKVKTVSGAEISLSGKVDSLSLVANTGGFYEGFNLQCMQADVSSSTGAEVEINAVNFLKATAKLKGLVIYNNMPKKIVKKEILTGKVFYIKEYKNSDGSIIYND